MAHASEMIVPVTPNLAAELVSAASLIELLDGRSVTDKNHFVKVVDQLESLTLAVLKASASVELTVRKPPVARFGMSNGGQLHGHVVGCVAYLRDVVSKQLDAGAFSAYNRPLTEVAFGNLKQMEGLLRAAVVRTAEADLAKLSDSGVVNLLMAAEALAKAAATPADHAAGSEDIKG